MSEDSSQKDISLSNNEKIKRLNIQIGLLTTDISLMKSQVTEHGAKIDGIKSDTSELVELFKNVKSGAKFVIFAGRLAKFTGYISAAIALIYTAYLAVKTAIEAHIH